MSSPAATTLLNLSRFAIYPVQQSVTLSWSYNTTQTTVALPGYAYLIMLRPWTYSFSADDLMYELSVTQNTNASESGQTVWASTWYALVPGTQRSMAVTYPIFGDFDEGIDPSSHVSLGLLYRTAATVMTGAYFRGDVVDWAVLPAPSP